MRRPVEPARAPGPSEKGAAFRALHERDGAFVIPNPWDAGTARMLASLGFEALATTSAGFAFSSGVPDNAMGRDAMLAHVARIAAATSLPVSGDLENGYGDAPAAAADTIRRAGEAGLVGGSIEDRTLRPDAPLHDLARAVDRVRAAVEAARGLSFPFTLTARTECLVVGRTDLGEVIRRLQAYQEAGADVLFAPGLKRPEDIGTVVRSVDRPVNVLMSAPGVPLDVAGLSELGVKRISVGSALARVALGAFLGAARELRSRGSFGFTERAATTREILSLLG